MAHLKAEVVSVFLPSNWPFPEFQNPGISEFRILEFWNSGILEMANLKAEVVSVFLPSNWPLPEFQNPGIQEFRILEFWNSGIVEFWKWPI